MTSFALRFLWISGVIIDSVTNLPSLPLLDQLPQLPFQAQKNSKSGLIPPPPMPPPPMPPSLQLIKTIDENCGKVLVQGTRVINGENAQTGAWPWQVLLMYRDRPFCGGSIIDPFWVVTATHCLKSGNYSLQPTDISIRVGATNFLVKENHRKRYDASKLFTNERFNWNDLQEDVGLIKLQIPLEFNSYVQPICLPKSDVTIGTKCTITGWGRSNRSNTSGMSPTLQQAKLPVISNKLCELSTKKYSSFPITHANLCAGTGKPEDSSGCHGDSGGPLACLNKNHRWELQGVVSWGSENCSERKDEYSVFARINYLKQWINKIRGNN